ncbi:putative inactive peptidyl-prolyl cis-trans isomerase-like 6 [Halichoeres trimaculatus]|uniref:putative inactive peptidyl-prolyl cis-trans isomerase-like 6 n=1 Tax=Halichoeres trimaculatus TaxID=147232 RepID=UPI003D9E64EF
MDLKLHLKIVGLIKSHTFHVAKHIAEKLKLKFPKVFLDPEIQPFLELDWHAYLCWKKRELHGEVWQDSSSLMCLLNGIPLGDEQELASWAENQWSFTVAQPVAFFMVEAGDCYTKHLKKSGHQFVFMDIQIAGEAAGRLLFELFSDICPKTSKNFEALCTGEFGQSSSGFPLCYKGSVFHRVVPNGWIQGGDISPDRKGDGGESIYGPTFEDESFAVPHSRRGILGMANKGSHTNGSQFYITLRPSPWMDRTFVAFGRVVEGVDTLRRLETALTCNERPKYDCKVTDCGVLKC